ncbi:MAG: hypothetical protein HQM03_08660 [Magnetococcales bacterium]|nr:hypothetical protein [Magnetococcales bacterium]
MPRPLLTALSILACLLPGEAWLAPTTIDMRVDAVTRQRFTARDWREQQRDWLMLAALLADQNLPPATRQRELTAMPALRLPYLRSLGEWEFGVTRERSIDDHTLLVLLPAGLDREQRQNLLTGMADRHRLRTGVIPQVVRPFAYRLSDDSFANLHPEKEEPGQPLFTAASGYQERILSTLPDLEAFLRDTDLLLGLALEGDGQVRLMGRKRLAASRLGVNAEDVAALWQAERALGDDQKGGMGFSLEPLFDHETLPRFFRERLAPLLTTLLREAPEQALADTEAALLRRDSDDLFLLLNKIASQGADPRPLEDALAIRFLEFLASCAGKPVENAWNAERMARFRAAVRDEGWGRFVREMASCTVLKNRFQYARYDGNLQGTGVGMTLFLTDLLAKLWGMDDGSLAPVREIEDFVPIPRVVVSPLYWHEMTTRPDTRLWFGPRRSGHAMHGEKLLLAGSATRVHAASSDPLLPGQEEEANGATGAFLGWWNDHYEEVAHYEPEFQRLDAIMRWSLALGWLAQRNASQRLAFLARVAVDRSAWFPEWARGQPRFPQPPAARVAFLPRGHRGIDTESFPILKSAPYAQGGGWRFLHGGVSLGGRSDFVPSSGAWSGPAPPERLRGPNEEIAPRPVPPTALLTAAPPSLENRVGDLPVGRLRIESTDSETLRMVWESREWLLGQELARRIGLPGDPAAWLGSWPDLAEFTALDCRRCYLVRLRDASRRLRLAPEPPSADGAWDGRVADPAGMVIRMVWMGEEKSR